MDVVVTATRDQGRLADDFDEPAFRARFAEWTRAQVLDETGASTTSVVEADGDPVGRLRVERDPARIHLAGLQLLPHAQNRGIGTRLITALQREARTAGTPLDITVERDNPRARRLYERLGCIQVAEDDSEHTLRWQP